MIIEMYRLTRNPLCIHQYNAMGCYDRIIRNHAILYSQKFGIPTTFINYTITLTTACKSKIKSKTRYSPHYTNAIQN